MGLEREKVEKLTPAGVTFAQFIQDMAAKAKLNVVQKGPDLVMVPWDLADGRKQNTFVRPLGTTGAGYLIVGFFSPSRRFSSEQDLAHASAIDLLRKNARIPHGSWGIASVNGEEYLGVCDTQIAQTMQPEEFHASCLAIAQLADALEKQLGADVF